MSHTSDKPANWGQDKLTTFFDECRINQFANYSNKPIWTSLKQIDDCFFRILDKPINPRPFFPIQFLYRSHAAFRSACALAMAGQVFEANVMLRLCLETAAYGYYVSLDDSIAETWIKRHDGPAELKACKNLFQYGKIRDRILSNAVKLGEILEELYERTIDFGAHPNFKGIAINSKINKTEDQTEYLQIYLHDDGLALDFSLKSCAQVGIWSLSIYQLIYPEKFLLLGIKSELEALTKRF
jgi:hypothetical protein